MTFLFSLVYLLACGANAEAPAVVPVAVPATVPDVAPPPPATVPILEPTPIGEATPATETPGTAAKPGAQVDTLLGKVSGVAFVGDWTSPPCGGRSYARNIRFESDQEYGVIELISPCPVGTTCIWSGLGTFAGLWDQQGTKLILQEIGMTKNVPGGPHPVLFESTADGRLVENGCFYTKGLTVPPGYTEDKVRPKLGGAPTTAPTPAETPPVEAVPAK